MDSAIFSNPKLAAMYSWALLKANWKEKDAFETRNKVTVKPGQFITSLPHAAKELGMGVATVDVYLDILKSERIIERQATPKYTVITVLNWEELQNPDRLTESKRKANGKLTETTNTLKTLKTINTTENSLQPLTNKQRYEIAHDLRVDFMDVVRTEKEVLSPENIKKYNLHSTSRTTRKWLTHNIRLGNQRTLDDFGMIALETTYERLCK